MSNDYIAFIASNDCDNITSSPHAHDGPSAKRLPAWKPMVRLEHRVSQQQKPFAFLNLKYKSVTFLLLRRFRRKSVVFAFCCVCDVFGAVCLFYCA